jgi:hypothetical protein
MAFPPACECEGVDIAVSLRYHRSDRAIDRCERRWYSATALLVGMVLVVWGRVRTCEKFAAVVGGNGPKMTPTSA